MPSDFIVTNGGAGACLLCGHAALRGVVIKGAQAHLFFCRDCGRGGARRLSDQLGALDKCAVEGAQK